MLNFGFGEIALIMVLAIVVVGPDRLPEMLQFLGKQYGKVMRASNDLKRAFMLEADRAEAEKRAELLRERREQARVRAQEAREKALAAARARAAAGANQPAAPSGEVVDAQCDSAPPSTHGPSPDSPVPPAVSDPSGETNDGQGSA
ncbi:MAG: twin-arginine translocase TatA/TatE family subunit [Myxococcota bacterium]|nr:twin-arginine translocase TatA/TatE family subunit [Myxococcota bacterium]